MPTFTTRLHLSHSVCQHCLLRQGELSLSLRQLYVSVTLQHQTLVTDSPMHSIWLQVFLPYRYLNQLISLITFFLPDLIVRSLYIHQYYVNKYKLWSYLFSFKSKMILHPSHTTVPVLQQFLCSSPVSTRMGDHLRIAGSVDMSLLGESEKWIQIKLVAIPYAFGVMYQYTGYQWEFSSKNW